MMKTIQIQEEMRTIEGGEDVNQMKTEDEDPVAALRIDTSRDETIKIQGETEGLEIALHEEIYAAHQEKIDGKAFDFGEITLIEVHRIY